MFIFLHSSVHIEASCMFTSCSTCLFFHPLMISNLKMDRISQVVCFNFSHQFHAFLCPLLTYLYSQFYFQKIISLPDLSSFQVRKRPLNKKEISRKEDDIVTVHENAYLTVDEPKMKVCCLCRYYL